MEIPHGIHVYYGSMCIQVVIKCLDKNSASALTPLQFLLLGKNHINTFAHLKDVKKSNEDTHFSSCKIKIKRCNSGT